MVELRLSDILQGFLRERGFSERLSLYLAYGRWEELVGVEVAKHVRPVRMERGVLYLVADSGVWAQETSFARVAILARMHKAGIPVKDLRFRQGTLPPPEQLPELPKAGRRPPAPPQDALELIRDPGLKERFAQLLADARKEGD